MSVNEKMTAIANEVRSLSGVADKLNLDEMAAHTKDANTEVDTQEDLIQQIKTALQGKSAVGDAEPVIHPLEVTENGTYTAPDGVDGYSPVTVNVPIPDGYIQPSGELEVTENGTHDVTAYASVNVNVEASGGDPKVLLDAALNNTLTAIDSNVTRIVAYACRGLSQLKTVNLPNATSIGTYAFYYCTAMTSINAPKVTSLGTYAFYNCDKLTSVNFPLATGIAKNVLYSCSVLKKADFGVASKINQAAFAYCEVLEALILRRTSSICTLSVATNAFSGTPIADGTGYVYVPAALIEEYKVATNWTNYASQFRAIEDYPEICGG